MTVKNTAEQLNSVEKKIGYKYLKKIILCLILVLITMSACQRPQQHSLLYNANDVDVYGVVDSVDSEKIQLQPKSEVYLDSFFYVSCSLLLVSTLSYFVYATKLFLDKKEFIKYYDIAKEKYDLSNMFLNGRKINNVSFPPRYNFLADGMMHTVRFIVLGIAFFSSYILANY